MKNIGIAFFLSQFCHFGLSAQESCEGYATKTIETFYVQHNSLHGVDSMFFFFEANKQSQIVALSEWVSGKQMRISHRPISCAEDKGHRCYFVKLVVKSGPEELNQFVEWVQKIGQKKNELGITACGGYGIIPIK